MPAPGLNSSRGRRCVPNVVVDTGPLVSLFKRKDRDHARVVDYLKNHPCTLITTWPVVTEAWHLLSPPAALDLVRWIAAGGLVVCELGEAAAPEMAGLLAKYRDRPMELADASLVLLAQRTGVIEILTIDRADFDTYRLPDRRRFNQVL